MAYVIAAPCVDHNDRLCLEVCPVDCIAGDPNVDRMSYIDRDECIDCGACVEVCPNQAIFRHDQLPPEWAPFEQIGAQWYRDPQTARVSVNQVAG